jgi:hypothetical protein
LEDVHNAIHQHDLEKIEVAEQQAGDAAISAKTAHDDAEAVKLGTAAIQERLNAASMQLSVIEEQVRVQGPRWKLLEDNRAAFIEAVKPFAGQRFTVVKCGLQSPPRTREVGTRLVEFLRQRLVSKPAIFPLFVDSDDFLTACRQQLTLSVVPRHGSLR